MKILRLYYFCQEKDALKGVGLDVYQMNIVC